jgi:hypothetical protein
MHQYNKIVASPWLCLVPIVVLLSFVSFYVSAQVLIIQCDSPNIVNCEEIQVKERLLQIPTGEARPNAFPPNELKYVQSRYSGRMLWMFVACAYVLSCISVLCIFWFIAAYWLDSGKWATVLLVGGCILAMPFLVMDSTPLAKPLFENTVANHWAGISNFFDIVRLIGALAYGTSMSMVLVVSAILFARPRPKNLVAPNAEGTSEDGRDLPIEDVDPRGQVKYVLEDEETLAKKRDHLTTVLYASTILLVVGIFLWDQNFTWAVSFIEDDPIASETGKFFTSVTATLGGFFTLLLAGIYLPAAFILHERAKLAIEAAGVRWQDVPAELEKRGFTISFSQSLPRILAIAAPLLTGPVAELFKNMKLG